MGGSCLDLEDGAAWIAKTILAQVVERVVGFVTAPFQEVLNLKPEDCTYPWIEMEYAKLKGIYKHAPQKGQFDHQIQVNLIVEFYSR